jgi:predicted Fe-Mo cluster-binding NifX family protein
MKIAAITDDGTTISQHFGWAEHYAVLTVENGQVVGREMRDKFGHQNLSSQDAEHQHSGPHGFDAASQDKHARMAASIVDCQVLLCRGMGWGAYQSMEQAGIKPILTNIADIETAVKAYLSGTIVDHRELLH